MQSPDIIGVEEVEHESTLQALAVRINADTVADTGSDPQYVARLAEGNDPGGIDVGFLVKASRVTIDSVDAGRQGHDIPAARFQHAGSPQRSPVARARGDGRRAVRDDRCR